MAAKPREDFLVQAFGPAPVVSAGGRMRAVAEFIAAGLTRPALGGRAQPPLPVL
jgi:hypothetical protein